MPSAYLGRGVALRASTVPSGLVLHHEGRSPDGPTPLERDIPKGYPFGSFFFVRTLGAPSGRIGAYPPYGGAPYAPKGSLAYYRSHRSARTSPSGCSGATRTQRTRPPYSGRRSPSGTYVPSLSPIGPFGPSHLKASAFGLDPGGTAASWMGYAHRPFGPSGLRPGVTPVGGPSRRVLAVCSGHLGYLWGLIGGIAV